jgi:hypothetical protein
MRVAPFLIVGATGCGLTQPAWHATPEQMAPVPALSTHVTSTIGPLALEPGAGETSWSDTLKARKITENHYLDGARIHAETTTFLAFLDAFYQPLTPETKIGFDQAHRDLGMLEKLDPYSMYNVTLAFQQSTQRLHLCILNAGVMWPCAHDRKARARRTGTPVFEIGEAAPGIATLAVHDLGNADDPAWRGFADAKGALANARGLVLDLRDAAGADPRALVPWLAEITGGPVAPLRAIERPASADPYVEAYRARYTDRGRDPAIWSALLGRGDVVHPRAAPKQPISIVVGRYCESACELVARVLETYAGAVVVGGVSRSGRLARDEPAMFVLPHSQTSVYFHATRYLLAADIEAATGPSEEWRAFVGDALDDLPKPPNDPHPVMDYMTFAVRDVAQRIANPAGWPRCDALPVATRDSAKLHGLAYLATDRACPSGYEITLHSEVPASALGRFLTTCSTPATLSGFAPGLYMLRTPAKPTPAMLSQIAASELVRVVNVECQVQYFPN